MLLETEVNKMESALVLVETAQCYNALIEAKTKKLRSFNDSPKKILQMIERGGYKPVSIIIIACVLACI